MRGPVESARDLEPPLLGRRQLMRQRVDPAAEPGEIQDTLGLRHGRARRAGPGEGADHDVFQHAHGIEAAHDLEGARDAEPRAGDRPQARDPLAVEPDLARIGRDLAGDAVEQRGLAGAVRTDQAQDLALGDAEADLDIGGDAAERLGDPVDLKQRGHRRLPTGS
jgi:hypothetical protein